MLEVANLNVEIQGVPVLRNASLSVVAGEMVGLVGRNGAGKTTFMRAIMGLISLSGGRIRIVGNDVTELGGYERVRLMVGYMPEDRRLIPDLTVEENILVPAWVTGEPNSQARIAWIYELMPEVSSLAKRPAVGLSGGQQKLVALGRALMAGHKVILLDEPFEGVAPTLSRRLANVIHTLKAEGLSVLISESDYTNTKGIVDRCYLIERGGITPKS